jgi:hypothetical protein
MHRPSTPAEREELLGPRLAGGIEVVDHRADEPETLVRVSDEPPVSVCRRFVEADFRIVTGYIEPHFMAGFSGGRKGVCPALVDLETIRRFHGWRALADARAENGLIEGNPCHAISLAVARAVGVDFLFNVAITSDHRAAGIWCGDLEAAHAAGCEQVRRWTTARVREPFDLVVTCGGGYPLVTALPALGPTGTLLQVSHCGEGVGSRAYQELMLRWGGDWRGFLADLQAHPDRTELDQWEYQMHARVLARIGAQNLWLATDGIAPAIQARLSVRPVPGRGDAQSRAQHALTTYLAAHPAARVCVLPDGPYTLLAAECRPHVPTGGFTDS